MALNVVGRNALRKLYNEADLAVTRERRNEILAGTHGLSTQSVDHSSETRLAVDDMSQPVGVDIDALSGTAGTTSRVAGVG